MTHRSLPKGRTVVPGRPSKWFWRFAVTALLVAVVLPLQSLSPASAVVAAAPATTLSNAYIGVSGVTYTFSGYTVANGEMATGAQITFPAGTDITLATLAAPAGTMTISGQTVTITFTPSLLKGGPITISIANITNPMSPNVYNVGSITFSTANPKNNNPRAPQVLATGDYTILDPLFSLTIVGPSGGASVDFGAVDPGVSTPPQDVTITVSSGVTYSITRSFNTDAGLMGLTVTGGAEGTGLLAGVRTYTDSYVITPPWSTAPNVPLAGLVTYTVIQN